MCQHTYKVFEVYFVIQILNNEERTKIKWMHSIELIYLKKNYKNGQKSNKKPVWSGSGSWKVLDHHCLVSRADQNTFVSNIQYRYRTASKIVWKENLFESSFQKDLDTVPTIQIYSKFSKFDFKHLNITSVMK
jgi:hypothetical protein